MRHCKICCHENLRKVVDNLRNNGLSYRQIQDYLLTKFNVKVGLWTLSNHFWHTQQLHSNIPKLDEDEIILGKEILDKICNNFMMVFKKHIKDANQVEKFLSYLDEYMQKEPEPKLETNKTVFQDLEKIVSNSPLEDSLKANMLKELTDCYFQIIPRQRTTY
jgi:septation ring formation regulator EzrA